MNGLNCHIERHIENNQNPLTITDHWREKKKKKPRLKSNGNKTPHSQTNPGIE